MKEAAEDDEVEEIPAPTVAAKIANISLGSKQHQQPHGIGTHGNQGGLIQKRRKKDIHFFQHHNQHLVVP